MTAMVRPRAVPRPALRLIVFHHAGGSSAAYMPLARALPGGWELLLLDLPGRGRGHRASPLTEMPSLVAATADAVLEWAGPPVALFGHSLGAIVALETARRLEARGVTPLWVGVSGRPAPECPVDEARPLCELPDRELIGALARFGGIPAELDELPEFRDRFVRLVRADLRALDSYVPQERRRPLDAPLTAFGAVDDELAPADTVEPWSRETAGGFRARMFTGGHFHFLGRSFAGFAKVLVEEVGRAVDAAAGTGPGRERSGPLYIR
ncbi:thioesterase [Actinomadura sp. NAK00032]|uniref:thioesterase II family protein n=1 Tax=Actinomadura sp. NAK00032 TaxID=2742128 RepID=UPI001590BA07|nr:alpha/beta fold hydrolase [Actinomadura sp. NAK00032]QKW37594.1 thioesterase [Actinomadura sp. NAK00032]